MLLFERFENRLVGISRGDRNVQPFAENSLAQLELMPGPPPTMSATSPRSPDCAMCLPCC